MDQKITVIVPAYNAASTLPQCLAALQNQADEIIVVDDCSTDNTREIARDAGCLVLQTPERGGPAGARNLGALSATGEILFFVDADVVIQRDATPLIRQRFQKDPMLAAIFGSYDDDPAEKNFLSQYKNLLHHFVHQKSNPDATTFWAGCGAVRKDIFHSVGGFNAQMYPHPSIEDIELGFRIKLNNHSILLEKSLQGKHLKQWTIYSLLRADILFRAYPWSKLIAQAGEVPNQLNLETSQRISSMLSGGIIALILSGLLFAKWWLGVVAVFCLILLIALNRDLYSFFLRKKGLLFLVGAIFWHILYYVYSAIIFVYCWIRFRIFGRRNQGSIPANIKMAPHEKR